MNYKDCYERLIQKATTRGTVDGYYEIHHIIPRSMGGSDNASNLVHLTGREHFVAHLLLAKIYGGPMLTALWAMKNRTNVRMASRTYEWLRTENSRRMSAKMTGRKKSPEHLHNISESLKVSEKHKNNLKKLHDSSRGKSNAHKGRKQDPEWIAKRVAKLKGQKRSDETKQKMADWVRSEDMKQKISTKLIGNQNRRKKDDV